MTIYHKIIQLFDLQSEWTIKDIVARLDSSKQMVHLALNRLLEEGRVVKYGRTPKTFYVKKIIAEKTAELADISKQETDWLDAEFLLITETGDLKKGYEAFDLWCKQRKLPVAKTLVEYKKTKEKYKQYYGANQVIDGMEKLNSTKGYDAIYLDKLFYLDFYAIERFGKTRLGTLIHYAKQGQNKFLMKILVQEINEKMNALLLQYKVEAICFVPPTIRREVQINKISGIIPVPQKSLQKLEERISNAKTSFSITDNRHFKTIAMIDDAVGSGATMNEIAKKLKSKNVASSVIGIAITGSFKGFDVITDV